MDVNILNLQTLFTMPIRYEMPPLQRRYVWEQELQWEPLWNDVRNTSEDYLETGDQKDIHFLGAIVIQQQLQPVGMLNTRLVVDGQQRLTTMQLLLDATQEVLEERKVDSAAKRLSNLVLNGEEFHDDDDPYSAFKVLPTIDDRPAFKHAMSNQSQDEKFEESLIVQAHEFFKLQIGEWLDQLPHETAQRITALEITLCNLLEMVVIDLSQNDNPHVIFETLNARGTPLLESDKVKNFILFEASKKGIDDETKVWDFDGDWWNEEVYQGRLLRPRVDAFLNVWLVMRKCEEVAPSSVFTTFNRYFEGEGKKDVEVVSDDLRRLGEIFARLEKHEVSEDMKPFLYRIATMRVGVLTPVLMWLSSSGVHPYQKSKALLAIESHLVRRMICGMTTRSYGRLFIGMLTALKEKGAAHAGDTTFEYLKSQTAWATLWPDDQQLKEAFLHRPVYRLLTRGRARVVLEGIETGLRTDKADSKHVPRNLTIEHIMPQAWRQNWKLPYDIEDKAQADSNRDHIIHTMGNLSLTTGALGSSLSNRPWSEKREILREHFNLSLNKDYVDEAKWDEKAIEERARQLAQVAIKVWPHADGI